MTANLDPDLFVIFKMVGAHSFVALVALTFLSTTCATIIYADGEEYALQQQAEEVSRPIGAVQAENACKLKGRGFGMSLGFGGRSPKSTGVFKAGM